MATGKGLRKKKIIARRKTIFSGPEEQNKCVATIRCSAHGFNGMWEIFPVSGFSSPLDWI